MKLLKFVALGSLICLSFFVISCGSGGGSTTSDSGTVTMSVTDAKPLLPAGVENFFVEFLEVWVHKPGKGWTQLDLSQSPYTIDLLQFQDGSTTELVPPALLTSGKYTQVRFVLNGAWLGIPNGGGTERVPVEIPSEFLRTDKNFTIDVGPGSAIDLVVHFDLSMSLVVSGTESEPKYSLKPVLHLFGDPLKAAAIDGTIENNSLCGLEQEATVKVYLKTNEGLELYTQHLVEKSTESDLTPFSIFWLVPSESYTVEIDLNEDNGIDWSQEVPADILAEGELYPLNSGAIIVADEGICNP